MAHQGREQAPPGAHRLCALHCCCQGTDGHAQVCDAALAIGLLRCGARGLTRESIGRLEGQGAGIHSACSRCGACVACRLRPAAGACSPSGCGRRSRRCAAHSKACCAPRAMWPSGSRRCRSRLRCCRRQMLPPLHVGQPAGWVMRRPLGPEAAPEQDRKSRHPQLPC